MALFSDKSWDDWVREYGKSHTHPINRRCHTIGIPMILLSLVLAPLGWLAAIWWQLALVLFVVGWVFQFVGHIYEKKPPEFFHDWRFLFVGARWWLSKVFGRRG